MAEPVQPQAQLFSSEFTGLFTLISFRVLLRYPRGVHTALTAGAQCTCCYACCSLYITCVEYRHFQRILEPLLTLGRGSGASRWRCPQADHQLAVQLLRL